MRATLRLGAAITTGVGACQRRELHLDGTLVAVERRPHTVDCRGVHLVV